MLQPPSRLLGIHHAAIICSDYARSRQFYTDILGLKILAEHYRAERDSYKLDLQLPDGSQIELFSFPQPPARVSRPEACGLRHLAFRVADLSAWHQYLIAQGLSPEAIRLDEYTGKRFSFSPIPIIYLWNFMSIGDVRVRRSKLGCQDLAQIDLCHSNVSVTRVVTVSLIEEVRWIHSNTADPRFVY